MQPPEQQQPLEPQAPFQVPIETIQATNSPPTKTPQPKKKFIIICLIILLIISIGAFLVLRPTKSQPSNQSQDKSTASKVSNISYTSYESAYDGFYSRGINEFSSAKKESTIKAMQELTNDFNLESKSKATDSTTQLIALGTAYLYAEKKTDKSVARNKLYLLFQESISQLPSGITDENASMPKADQAKIIYEKYQDKGLSNSIRKTISERGLEKQAKEILKITDGQLADYQVYAMNFDPKSDEEKKFTTEMKYTGWMPSLWTQSYPDAKFVGFTKKYAQDFISESSDLTQAYFLHEFSHTQKPLSRGGLGFLAEERKAEEISGNKGSYYDVKQFFIYLNIFTGFDALKVIADDPTNANLLYVEMYKNIGVELADSVFSSFPNVYTENASTPIRIVSKKHTLDNTLRLAIALGAEQDLSGQQKRLQDRANRLISVLGSKERAINDTEENLAKIYRMPSAAEQLLKYLK
jgi:uncharacterized protein YpmB